MTTKKNLWGNIPLSGTHRNPSTLLREQANVLSEITNGLLVGEVKPLPHPTARELAIIEAEAELSGGIFPKHKKQDSKFQVGFRIVAPKLSNYKYSVLQVQYPIQFYPLELIDLANDERSYNCADEESFEQALEKVLTSEKIRSVIEALLSQIQQD